MEFERFHAEERAARRAMVAAVLAGLGLVVVLSVTPPAEAQPAGVGGAGSAGGAASIGSVLPVGKLVTVPQLSTP